VETLTKQAATKNQDSLILKMSDRSFFERKISDLENCLFFAYFCSFAPFERAKERSLFLSLFLKERSLFLSLFLKEQKSNRSIGRSFLKRAKKERSIICSFEKSAEKSDRLFALMQRAPKRAIAHSLFCKERQKEQLLIRSF